MSAIYVRIRAELELVKKRVDQRLNVVASLVAGLIVANSAQFQAAITSLVPARYQALAGFGAAAVVYLTVRAAAARDAKKAAGNG